MGASASENVEEFMHKTNESGHATWKRTPKTVVYTVVALETLMLTLLYFPLVYILRTPSWGVSRPDLASKQAVSMLSIALTALPGLKAWLGSGPSAAVHITDRFHGYNKMGELICVHFLCYQLFDLGISLAIPDLRKPEMIAHHVSFNLTLLTRLAGFICPREERSPCSSCLHFGMQVVSGYVAWLGISHQFAHYYAVFFLGICEVVRGQSVVAFIAWHLLSSLYSSI
jgi:hypothetical protein